MIEFFNTDCMSYMASLPDKAFNLVLADPPYGIGVGNMAYLKEINTRTRQKNGTLLNGNRNKKPYTQKDWDKNTPPQEYFDEVKRVSHNQIIFGIDYMNWTGVGTGRIRWNKGVPEGMSFNKYEIAYCSLTVKVVDLDLLWAGMCQAKSLSEPMVQQGNKKLNEKRIHPCHNPIFLYQWLLQHYAKPGDRILDTHGGSMSSAIACDMMGFDATVCEIDKDYFDAALLRFKNYKAQGVLEFPK